MAKERWRALTNPSKAEKKAQRIEIECVETPGKDESEGYIVYVTPKTAQSKPGKTVKNPPYIYSNPVKRIFRTDKEVIDYLEEIL